MLEDLDVSIYAVAVPHGMMPSVAFRVGCGAESVVFSGDISASTASFIALAKNCSMLVHGFGLSEGEVPEWKAARKALCSRLHHLMPPMESELAQSLTIVRSEYDGPIEVAGRPQSVPNRRLEILKHESGITKTAVKLSLIHIFASEELG